MLRALILVVAIALSAASASAQRVPLQIDNAGKQTESPQKQTDPPPRAVPPEEPAQSAAYQADCSNPIDHDAADWCEQKRAADGAARAANAAADALEIARNQSLLLWLTLSLTAAALWAAFRSANAAHKTLVGLERPYVLFPRFSTFWTTTTYAPTKAPRYDKLGLHIDFVAQNYGRVPCVVREISVSFEQAKKWGSNFDSGHLSGGAEVKWPNWILAAGDSEADWFHIELEPNAFDYSAFELSSESLFVRGEIIYEDVQGNRYRRRLNYRQEHGEEAEEYGGRAGNSDTLIRPRTLLDRIRTAYRQYSLRGRVKRWQADAKAPEPSSADNSSQQPNS